MTVWTAAVGEILDARADALICSANPQLNLSGGVGGAFLLRYGSAMQEFLHAWLKDHDRRYVNPGHIVVAPPCGSPFRAVVHAVAIDAFYQSSAEIIRETYAKAFAAVTEAQCRSVATTCLACGYGRVTPSVFVQAVSDLVRRDVPGIDRVEFTSTNAELITALRGAING